MTEREKVIKGLELCLGSIESAGCPKECPYYEACQKYENYVVFQPVMKDALELLKAQEPVEPLAEYSVHTGSKWAICGKCHEPLAKASDKEMPNYCPFCGRAVKWK